MGNPVWRAPQEPSMQGREGVVLAPNLACRQTGPMPLTWPTGLIGWAPLLLPIYIDPWCPTFCPMGKMNYSEWVSPQGRYIPWTGPGSCWIAACHPSPVHTKMGSATLDPAFCMLDWAQCPILRPACSRSDPAALPHAAPAPQMPDWALLPQTCTCQWDPVCKAMSSGLQGLDI